MDLDFSGHLNDSSAHFDQLEPDRAKFCLSQLRAGQVLFSQGMQNNIGHAVEKESELIGMKTGARGAIRE